MAAKTNRHTLPGGSILRNASYVYVIYGLGKLEGAWTNLRSAQTWAEGHLIPGSNSAPLVYQYNGTKQVAYYIWRGHRWERYPDKDIQRRVTNT